MAGQKVLTVGAGGALTEIAANQASAGAGDAGKLVSLDGTGKIDATMMPNGIGANATTLVFSEAVSANAPVNIYNNAGTPTARNADASTGKAAHGYVTAAIAQNANGTVFYNGVVSGQTGLVPGAAVYLGGAPGTIAAAGATASGYISQQIGYAISTTQYQFEYQTPITRA